MGKEKQEARQTLTIEEAARVLGIGRGLAYQLAQRGDLPALRLGGRLLVPVAALERLLADPPRPTSPRGEVA